jgi:putative transposase
MTYNPNLHHRRSIRLGGYDYSQPGAYYVTICTAARECVFGEVVNGAMHLNSCGTVARGEWFNLPRLYQGVKLDEVVVMPNHVHGIIWLTDRGRRPLSDVIGRFKTRSARRINERRNAMGIPLWQRDYYEHIVRDEEDLSRIRQYIVDNPVKWEEDDENPANWPPPRAGAGLIPSPQ